MKPQGPSAVREVRSRALGGGRTAIIVRLGGDVDLHSSPALRVELIRQAESRPGRLIIDLAEVAYMDSSGVATLVETLQRVRRYGGRMVLVAPQQRVLSIFQISRLDTIFQIAATVEEAVGADD